MKILLLSDNQAIVGVLGLCLDKPGFELVSDFSENKESDLVIKDVNEDALNLSEFDLKKTLFLVPRDKFDDLKVENKIIKPFLPTELIDFLTEYENKMKNDNDILSKSLELTKDTGNDPHSLNNILKDIDDLDEYEKSSQDDDFDNISDDISLEDLAKEFESNEDKIDDDIKHELDEKSEESLENLAIEFGDKFDKDDKSTNNFLVDSNDNMDIDIDSLLNKKEKSCEDKKIDTEKLSEKLENEIKQFISPDDLKKLKIIITFEEK